MTTKSAATEARILEAALELFRERGFTSATMRDIAARAGVATGLAYYYFDSKDAIVLAFYQRARHDLPALLEAAHQERALAPRLLAIIETKLRYFAPNRKFLGALMGHAADPGNALSPFGEASKEIREFDFAQFERALAETRTRVPKDLAPHMAKILWFYQMGILLFWIYDRSVGERRTRELMEVSVQVVVTLLKLSNLPLAGSARRSALKVVTLLTE